MKRKKMAFETEVQCVCKGGGMHLRGAKATTAYLEPNSNSMQKPVGGLPVLPVFSAKNLSNTKRQRERGLRK